MSTTEYTVIRNGTVLSPYKQIQGAVVVIEGHKIVDVGAQGSVQIPAQAEVIDAEGQFIAPGFIDIHVHGSNGADMLDATRDALETMSAFFATRGVTGFLATAITAPQERLLAALDCVRQTMQGRPLSGAELLGAHIEGPFLNPEQKGAHPEDCLFLPTPERYAPYLEYADVMRIMTLAPEREGAVGLIQALREAGVVPTMGHTHGIYRELAPGIDAGIVHAVHDWCNMSWFRRDNLKRVAGAAETILYDDRITTELIGDGWHVGDVLMKLAVKVKGVERVCWVTDAMSAAGMPPGRYFVGGVEAIVEHGIARLPDNTAYASSVTTLDVCVRNGIDRVELSLLDSVRMASLTPAQIIHVDDRKGSLEHGKDADIVIMDAQANISLTMAHGHVVYRQESSA